MISLMSPCVLGERQDNVAFWKCLNLILRSLVWSFLWWDRPSHLFYAWNIPYVAEHILMFQYSSLTRVWNVLCSSENIAPFPCLPVTLGTRAVSVKPQLRLWLVGYLTTYKDWQGALTFNLFSHSPARRSSFEFNPQFTSVGYLHPLNASVCLLWIQLTEQFEQCFGLGSESFILYYVCWENVNAWPPFGDLNNTSQQVILNENIVQCY